MCLIVLKKPGQTFDLNQFKIAVENNPDGYGLTYTNPGEPDGKLRTIRSKNKADATKLFRLMTEDLKDSHVLLHLRWNTSGKTILRNAHPFPVLEFKDAECDVRMAHNGHIHKHHTNRKGNESDTRQFVRSFVRPLFSRMSAGYYTDAILDDPFVKDLLEDECGSGSVLVFLSGDGDSMICNEQRGWYNEDGVFFSNKYSFNETHRTPSYSSSYVSRYFDDEDDWMDKKPSTSTNVTVYAGPKQTTSATKTGPVHTFKVGDKVCHKHVKGLTGLITACDGALSSWVTVAWSNSPGHHVRLHCDAIVFDQIELDKPVDKAGNLEYDLQTKQEVELVKDFEADDLVTLDEADFDQVMEKPEVAKALFLRMQDVIREYLWDSKSFLMRGA